jgi:calcineurin-like phosphoesterase family protein
MKRWIISDTHFYHKNIALYCGRPASHTNLLIDYMTSMVRREDVLYHLGDVHFGTENQLKAILSQVPGRKYLVRGNHDRWTDTKYMLCGFDGVMDAIVVAGAYLTHIPSLPPEGLVNVHGHLHNLGYSGEPAFGEGYEHLHDGRHVLYAPELEHYRPVRLEQLLARAKGVKKNAMHEIHLPGQQRMPNHGLYGGMPHGPELRSWEVSQLTYLEGGVSTKGMDWHSFNDAALERNSRIFPEDR